MRDIPLLSYTNKNVRSIVKKVVQNLEYQKKNNTFALHLNEWKVADMAQLVEQRIRNAWVPGSSPGIGSFV